MNKYKIKDKMFGYNFILLVDCSEKELSEYILKKHDASLKVSGCSGKRFVLGHDNGNQLYFIWVESFDWLIREQTILIHEIQHHVIGCLDYMGVKLSDDSEEVYAYYIQEIMTAVWNALAPKKKKRKK